MRYAPILSFLFGIAFLAIMLVMRPTQPTGHTDYALPQLTLMPYQSQTLWDQKKLQGRVTVLNFFASWCNPCAAEMPEFAALRKQFPNLSLEGVAWNDEPLALEVFLKKNGNPFRAIWIDPKGDATMALGIRGIPESFIVDANGTVRYRLSGPLTPQRLEALAPLIQQLLEEAKNAR